MQKVVLLFLCFPLTASISSASELALAYPLKEYVPVDFYRHSLLITPNFNLYQNVINNNPDLENSFENSNQANTFQLRLHHDYLKFSSAFELTGWSDFVSGENHGFSDYQGGIGDTSKSEWYSLSEKNTRFDYRFSTNQTGRYYFPNKTFIGYQFNADVWHIPVNMQSRTTRQLILHSQASSDSALFSGPHTQRHSDKRSISTGVRFPAGIGRIYDVSFPARIYFILDRISNRTGKVIEMDNKDMTALESFMENRRKVRPYFDTRSGDIYDIESMDQYLIQKSGLDHLPTGALLDIADEWNYSKWQSRKSGWDMRIYPYFRFQFDNEWNSAREESYYGSLPLSAVDSRNEFLTLDASTLNRGRLGSSEQSSFSERYFYGFGIAFAYEKPFRRFFQWHCSALTKLESMDAEIGNRSSSRSENDSLNTTQSNRVENLKYAFPSSETSIELGLNWYPSTRTTFSVSTATDYRVQYDYTGSKDALIASFRKVPYQDVHRYNFTFNLQGLYFLSPRLAFNGSFYGDKSLWHEQDGKMAVPLNAGYNQSNVSGQRISLGLNCGLQYYLF